MHLSRRRFLHLAGAGGALAATSPRAHAQAYPSRPLRWVVGFPPGGGADIVSRIMAPWLAERLGQPVVVENKPGASSNISIQTVVNAPPDGYTLLFVPASAAVNVSLFDNLPFNLLRDIAPVSGLIDFPLVMVANPSLPAQTVAEFITYAKANPGKISVGSFGTGSTSHVAGELFKMMTGTNMIHVPYRGNLVPDLMSGQVQMYFSPLPQVIEFVRDGRLRALAVTSATRSEALPDVPALAEFVPGYEASGWYGIGVPRGTPAAIVERLNSEINAGLADAKLKARLAELGYATLASSPAEFARFTGNTEVMAWCRERVKTAIVPEQIAPDGSLLLPFSKAHAGAGAIVRNQETFCGRH